MTTFWTLALLLSAIASGFIFVPLLYAGRSKRSADQNQDRKEVNVAIYKERLQELESGRENSELSEQEYAIFKAELEQTLLTDVAEAETVGSTENSASSQWIPIIAACTIPLLAILLYADWGGSMGSMADVELAGQLQQPERAPHEKRNMDQALANLQVRLQDEPDNHEGWLLLARSMLARGNYPKAIDALDHLLISFPEDTALLARQAQAMYLADGRKFTPRVQKFIDKTLLLDPNAPNILEILGMDAFDRGDYQIAIDYFNRMLRQDIGEGQANAIRDMVAQATTHLAVNNLTATVKTPVQGVIVQKSVDVLVEIDEQINVAQEDVVFVFARALRGPPMPLAAKKLTVADLPTLVRLDDSMSMDPNFTLSTVEEIQIVARVALSGQVTASPGDWQAVSAPLKLDGERTVIKLRISEAVQ